MRKSPAKERPSSCLRPARSMSEAAMTVVPTLVICTAALASAAFVMPACALSHHFSSLHRAPCRSASSVAQRAVIRGKEHSLMCRR